MKISDLVQNYLSVSRIREPKKSKERKFYISDMGKCQKMRWLKRKGIKTEFAPYVNWMFKIGDLYHDYAYTALESQGVLLESEDYVESPHFRGRYDGIVKDDEGKAVLDAKSVAGYRFNKILKGEDDEQAIAQVLTYQMLLEDGGMKDLVKSIILYLNKEPGDRFPFSFMEKHYRLTKWREDKLRAEMKMMADYWEKDEIPNCTCPGWMKAYNSFQPLCEMDKKKVRKVLKDMEDGKEFLTTKKALYLLTGKKRKEVAKVKKTTT